MNEAVRATMRKSNRLSAEEAAARLGVKKQTVYAYVSRGILGREKAVDGKASTFDADEVDRLRRRRLDDRPGRLEAPVTTAITDVRDGIVAYRGRPITELAHDEVGYEAVAGLLWEIPELGRWTAPKRLVEVMDAATNQLPENASLIDHLLLTAVLSAAHDPFRHDRDPTGACLSVTQLVATAVETLPCPSSRRRVRADSTIAERLWPRLTSAPRDNAHLLDQALMLLADHGMASSTLAARIAASTRAGPHACIISGLGALNGPLHGAAGRAVHLLLEAAERDGIDAALAAEVQSHGRVPGIGHFIHRRQDPRFALMIDAVLTSELPSKRLSVVSDMLERTKERIRAPHNIDFALGSLTYAAGMSADAGELIFAVSRIAGWTAHILEELEQAPLRFRPVGRYDDARPRPAPADA